METFVSATDLHGDRQDPMAVKLFMGMVDDFKPQWRIFKGDLWDFRAIRTGASKEERRHSMRADFNSGMTFLKWFKPNVLLLGNHDQRLWDVVMKDGLIKTGPLVDLASILIEEFDAEVKKLKTIILPYSKRQGVWEKSGLRFVHGFDGMDPQNMANIYGDVIYGHGHAIESSPAPKHGRVPVARQVGALCQLDMTYNRSQTRTMRQAHGWAYGAFLSKTQHYVMQARVEDDQVVYADSFKTFTA